MSLEGCHIPPIDVNFHIQKSLEIFDKNSADKNWYNEIKVSPLMPIRVNKKWEKNSRLMYCPFFKAFRNLPRYFVTNRVYMYKTLCDVRGTEALFFTNLYFISWSLLTTWHNCLLQGNLLKGIDNKTVRKLEFVYKRFPFSNTHFRDFLLIWATFCSALVRILELQVWH